MKITDKDFRDIGGYRDSAKTEIKTTKANNRVATGQNHCDVKDKRESEPESDSDSDSGVTGFYIGLSRTTGGKS